MRKTTLALFSLLFSTLSALQTNTVITTIPVGDTPAGIAVTPDSRFAYVANNNNDGIPNGDSVSVLNLTTNTLQETIHDSSFAEPYTITINAAGTRAYVTNSNSSTVSIIDTASNTVIGTIGGFDGPSGFVITPDGNHAYVNNYGATGGLGSGNGYTVRVVDLNTNSIVGPAIALSNPTPPAAPAALAITPDGAFVYVICYQNGNLNTGTISIIKTSDNTVQNNAVTGLSGPFKIVISPNGQFAYVTNFGSNNFSPVGVYLSVVSLSSNTIVDNIILGIQPSGVAITPDGSEVYVTNYSTIYNGPSFTVLTAAQGTIDIINTQNNTVNDSIVGGLGFSPSDIAIAPNGQFAYVSNYSSNTVSVIRLPSTTYNINRLTPYYNLQQDETMTKLTQAGLQ